MRKNIFRFALIITLIAVAIAAIAIVYGFSYRNNLQRRYEDLYAESLSASAIRLQTAMDDSLACAVALAADPLTEGAPVGYTEIGILSSSLLLGFGDTYQVTVTQDVFDKITGVGLQPEGAQPLAAVVSRGTYFEKDLILYAAPRPNAPGDYFILYESYDAFTEKLSAYKLSNLIVVDYHGYVLAASATFSYHNIHSAFPSKNLFGEVYETETVPKLPLADKSYYIFKDVLIEDAYYAVGLMDTAVIDGDIKKDLSRSNTFVILTCLVSFAGAVVLITIFFFVNQNYVNGSIAKNKYSLFVNKSGKILKQNKLFRTEFTYSDIRNCFMDDSLALNKSVGDADLILHMVNNEGATKYIRFISTETLQGYRLLGTDATPATTEFLDARYLANCDYLTRMPNMTQLELDYQKLCNEFPDEQFCFEIIDMMEMERYKVMFGQSFYDQLKFNFAKRLNSVFEGMIYQAGDTRFIIFSKNTEVTKFLTTELDKYTGLISAPIRVDTQFLIVEFKGGHCKPFLAKDRPDLEEVLRHAKFALMAAKESGNRNIVGFFDALMHGDAGVYEDKQAIIDLLESDQLTLFYQPQYNLHAKKIVGFEALTRIKKKTNMTIIDFIEHAERNGSIIELGNFVYRTAMSFAKKVEKLGVTISLNVSPVQLMQEGFVTNFLQFYKQFHLRPHSIAIEITESFLMSNYNRVVRILNMLHAEGIDIHLDDFGVVYSSMLYLKKLPITTIKIDREFIKDINYNGYSKMIVEIIAKSTKHLKLECIAEGVETEEQVELLRKLDCDIIQGYYIGQAVDEEAAIQLVAPKE